MQAAAAIGGAGGPGAACHADPQGASEGDEARRAADVESGQPDGAEAHDGDSEETGDEDDPPQDEDLYEGDEGGAAEPPRRRSWRIEDKIAACAAKWAPGEEPGKYVHWVFKLWRKTRLDEERMYRAVNKAVDVTRLRMDKGLIHSAGYMQYMLAVLRNEVQPEKTLPSRRFP